MADANSGAVKKSGSVMTIWGVLTIVLGLISMGSPLIAGISVARLAGFLLLAGGVARMVWAFGSDSFGQGALKFAIGGLTLFAGIAVLGRPLFALATLTLMLAGYFVIDGLFEILGAFHLKPGAGWGFLLFGGIVSLSLGIMIWRQFPISGAWAIGVLVGVKLLFSGLEMITVGAGMRAVAGAMPGTEEEE